MYYCPYIEEEVDDYYCKDCSRYKNCEFRKKGEERRKMIKHITRYRESEDIVTMTFEILNIKDDDTVNFYLDKIKNKYKENWIELLLVKGKNIKCELTVWVINDTEEEKEDVKNCKGKLIQDLVKEGFVYGEETIRGDGYC